MSFRAKFMQHRVSKIIQLNKDVGELVSLPSFEYMLENDHLIVQYERQIWLAFTRYLQTLLREVYPAGHWRLEHKLKTSRTRIIESNYDENKLFCKLSKIKKQLLARQDDAEQCRRWRADVPNYVIRKALNADASEEELCEEEIANFCQMVEKDDGYIPIFFEV